LYHLGHCKPTLLDDVTGLIKAGEAEGTVVVETPHVLDELEAPR
jgi:hypothetical protein